MLRKKIATPLIATAAVFAALAGPAATASARTATPATPAIPATYVSCSQAPSDGNCDGRWPDIDGCTGDATTVASTQVNGAVLELRWSPHCKTNWSRVTLGGNDAQVWVERADGKKEYSAWNYTNGQEWSPMVYAPVMTARACVQYKVLFVTYSGCTNWV